MKTVFKKIILLCTIIVTLNSCNKDDDAAPVAPATIEGRWEYSQEGAIIGGVENLEPYEHTATCNKDYMQFAAGGTFIDYSYEIPTGGVCTEFSDPGTWVRNNNMMTLNFGGSYTVNAEILNLTNTELKVKYSESGETLLLVFKR